MSPALPFATLVGHARSLFNSMTSLEKAMREFAHFAAGVKGDEKSEAQTFLFHLLAAFGHDAR